MTRKFRIWGKIFKQYYDEENSFLGANGDPYYYDYEDGLTSLDPEKDIIQFSTGLRDKNGKEIYEGDLVEDLTTFFVPQEGSNSFILKKRETNPLEVYWCEGEAQFRMKNDKHEYHESLVGRRIEIIGNIFENSELIEV